MRQGQAVAIALDVVQLDPVVELRKSFADDADAGVVVVRTSYGGAQRPKGSARRAFERASAAGMEARCDHRVTHRAAADALAGIVRPELDRILAAGHALIGPEKLVGGGSSETKSRPHADLGPWEVHETAIAPATAIVGSDSGHRRKSPTAMAGAATRSVRPRW
jgi:hypothetical protein